MVITMSDGGVLDELEINTYDVPVQLDLAKFGTYDELELAVVETAASSIVRHVEQFDEGDQSHITTKVDFNREGVKEAFHDDETEHLVVETKTRLGVLGNQLEEIEIEL
jgi:hypothetical protein